MDYKEYQYVNLGEVFPSTFYPLVGDIKLATSLGKPLIHGVGTIELGDSVVHVKGKCDKLFIYDFETIATNTLTFISLGKFSLDINGYSISGVCYMALYDEFAINDDKFISVGIIPIVSNQYAITVIEK